MSDEPKLQPGVGWRLQPDGSWKPESIPPEILKEAKFSGYLTIEGYRATVFDTPDKQEWAQKSTGTSALASRVAARYLEAKKGDLTSQVEEVLDDERQDTEYNDAIAHYCDTASGVLNELNDSIQACLAEFAKAAEKLADHQHERVAEIFAPQMKQALLEAARAIQNAGDHAIMHIVKDLKRLKADASAPRHR